MSGLRHESARRNAHGGWCSCRHSAVLSGAADERMSGAADERMRRHSPCAQSSSCALSSSAPKARTIWSACATQRNASPLRAAARAHVHREWSALSNSIQCRARKCSLPSHLSLLCLCLRSPLLPLPSPRSPPRPPTQTDLECRQCRANAQPMPQEERRLRLGARSAHPPLVPAAVPYSTQSQTTAACLHCTALHCTAPEGNTLWLYRAQPRPGHSRTGGSPVLRRVACRERRRGAALASWCTPPAAATCAVAAARCNGRRTHSARAVCNARLRCAATTDVHTDDISGTAPALIAPTCASAQHESPTAERAGMDHAARDMHRATKRARCDAMQHHTVWTGHAAAADHRYYGVLWALGGT